MTGKRGPFGTCFIRRRARTSRPRNAQGAPHPGASPPPPSPAALGQLDAGRASATVPSHGFGLLSRLLVGPEISPRGRCVCKNSWVRGTFKEPAIDHGIGPPSTGSRSGVDDAGRRAVDDPWTDVRAAAPQPSDHGFVEDHRGGGGQGRHQGRGSKRWCRPLQPPTNAYEQRRSAAHLSCTRARLRDGGHENLPVGGH